MIEDMLRVIRGMGYILNITMGYSPVVFRIALTLEGGTRYFEKGKLFDVVEDAFHYAVAEYCQKTLKKLDKLEAEEREGG